MAQTLINSASKRVCVVTGANKGIGYEICKQLTGKGVMVVLTARDEKRGSEAVEKLKAQGLADLVFYPLDVMDPASIASLADFIKTQFGKLDILVNNAGVVGSVINGEGQDLKFSIEDIAGPNAGSLKKFVKQNFERADICLKTNYYGVKIVTEALIPILELSDSATIVNVSSTLGQLKLVKNEKAKKELGDADGLTEERIDNVVQEFLEDVKLDSVEAKGWPTVFSAYIVSKAALNAYTRILAKKYPKIAINAVNPGFTRTDLNRNTGILAVEDGAKGPVMLALMPEGGPTGLFFDQTQVSHF